jgi:hypothetical protein
MAIGLMDITPECLGIEPFSSIIIAFPFASTLSFRLLIPVVVVEFVTSIGLVPLLVPVLIWVGSFRVAFGVTFPLWASLAPFTFGQEKRFVR